MTMFLLVFYQLLDQNLRPLLKNLSAKPVRKYWGAWGSHHRVSIRWPDRDSSS